MAMRPCPPPTYGMTDLAWALKQRPHQCWRTTPTSSTTWMMSDRGWPMPGLPKPRPAPAWPRADDAGRSRWQSARVATPARFVSGNWKRETGNSDEAVARAEPSLRVRRGLRLPFGDAGRLPRPATFDLHDERPAQEGADQD